MNISNYIESGIIERYLLGLTSPEQEEELLHLRQLYPLLDMEITAAEIRIEDKLQEEGVPPPDKLKRTVLQRIRTGESAESGHWSGYRRHEHMDSPNTYILEPFRNRKIVVSSWWRCAFIALTVLTLALAAGAWHFYHRAASLENVLIKMKAPPLPNPAPVTD